MHRGHRVVACIPAGRRRVLEPNLHHLRANPLIDEIQLWLNARTRHDIDFIRGQEDCRAILLDSEEPSRRPIQRNTGRFYRHTTDDDTVYIRFDDDIVWHHPDAVRNLVDMRLDNPLPFVVFANIWNNAITSYLQQAEGRLWATMYDGQPLYPLTKFCMDPMAWENGEFAVRLHNLLLDNIDEPEQFYLESQPLYDRTGRPLRFSVSCFAWFGHDFAPIVDDLWELEEEHFISRTYPMRAGKANWLCGDALVSHYSFHRQRTTLNETDILARYQGLAEDRLHDAYYEMMP